VAYETVPPLGDNSQNQSDAMLACQLNSANLTAKQVVSSGERVDQPTSIYASQSG